MLSRPPGLAGPAGPPALAPRAGPWLATAPGPPGVGLGFPEGALHCPCCLEGTLHCPGLLEGAIHCPGFLEGALHCPGILPQAVLKGVPPFDKNTVPMTEQEYRASILDVLPHRLLTLMPSLNKNTDPTY